ncbi:unnamed protein product, partial [Prorocentrum cordatum]
RLIVAPTLRAIPHSSPTSGSDTSHALGRVSWMQGLPDIKEGDNEERPRKTAKGGVRQNHGARAASSAGKGSDGKEKAAPRKGTKLVDSGELDDSEIDVGTMRKFFPVVMRLLLNVALRQRQLESIEMKTFIMSSGLQPAVKARGRVRAWIRAAEEIRKGPPEGQSDVKIRETGAISVACYAGVFEGLLAEGAEGGRASRQQLTTPAEGQAKLTVQEMGEMAPLAKISDCYEEGRLKLVAAFSGRLNLQPVLRALVQAGADYKQGAAPMGHLDRLIHAEPHELEGAMMGQEGQRNGFE